MATLTITKTYADGTILFESDLDNIKNDVEDFVNVTKLNDDNLQDSGITASDKLIDGTVSGAKLNSNAADNTTLEVSANTLSIKDLGVSTGKIADTAVTRAKQAALGEQISSSSGTFTTTSATPVDVTNLTVTITTSGRPVFVGIQGEAESASNHSIIGATENNANNTGMTVKILRDATEIYSAQVTVQADSVSATDDPQIFVPTSSCWIIDTPTSGTYTYKVQANVAIGAGTAFVQRGILVAYEL